MNQTVDPEIDLAIRLKNSTRGAHDRLERVGYFEALNDETLKLESYIAHLKAFSVILGVLESELDHCDDTRVKSLWASSTPKLPWLIEDLNFLKTLAAVEVVEPIRKAIALTDDIRLSVVRNPIAAIGVLYVFEGSSNGAAMMREDFRRLFKLSSEKGTRYLFGYGNQLENVWGAFRDRLNALVLSSEEKDCIIEAAEMTFSHLEGMFDSCYPLKPGQDKWDIADINPEAGNHPIPSDIREIIAAIEAGNKCLKEFPYFSWRFGERGVRFTRSDSTWLATLCDFDQERVHEQVQWLCRVLAPRGIPPYLMERHLHLLYNELCLAVPEKAKAYIKLEREAVSLRQTRESFLSDKQFSALATETENALASINPDQARGLGAVIISGIIDNAQGTTHTCGSIPSWLMNPNQFSEEWSDQVSRSIKLIESKMKRADVSG